MARDLFHQTVRDALEAEGWFITHDPLVLKLGGLRMEIDLAAEQMLAAERGLERIAVEVKSFIGKSNLNDFYEAKGNTMFTVEVCYEKVKTVDCIWRLTAMYFSHSFRNR